MLEAAPHPGRLEPPKEPVMPDPTKDDLEHTASEEEPGQGETTEEAAEQQISGGAQERRGS
ncbi:MAG TPA: hypothetical protein DIU42_09755 [Dermacoccus sp.]|nr:hypothetical protein [Dermacoccus sp.]